MSLTDSYKLGRRGKPWLLTFKSQHSWAGTGSRDYAEGPNGGASPAHLANGVARRVNSGPWTFNTAKSRGTRPAWQAVGGRL